MNKIFAEMLNKIIRSLKYRIAHFNSVADGIDTASIKLEGADLSGNVVIGKNSAVLHSRLLGDIKIGESSRVTWAVVSGQVETGVGCKINQAEIHGNVHIGRYTSLWGPNLDIYTKQDGVIIGSFCSIARNVSVQPYNHNTDKITTYFIGSNFFKERWENETVSKGSVTIKNDVWIGAHSVILGGVTIGDGAVVAANAVVTSDIPPYAIAAGTPAKVIGYRFSDETIKRLLTLAWWNWPDEKIRLNKHIFENELSLSSLNEIR